MHECHRESCYPCSCNQKSTSINLLVKSLFIEHHGSMRYLFSYFIGCLWNKLMFSTYLKKSSPLNQLAEGIQAVLSQIWEHREWVSSSHSRGCVDAWWWYTSHLGMVLCSIHSTSHFSSLGHLQRGWSEQWGEVQDSWYLPGLDQEVRFMTQCVSPLLFSVHLLWFLGFTFMPYESLEPSSANKAHLSRTKQSWASQPQQEKCSTFSV